MPNRDDEEKNFVNTSHLEGTLRAWAKRWPSAKLDSINVWDDIVTTRVVLLEKLNDRFSSYWAKEMEHFEHLIEEKKSEVSQPTEEKGLVRVKKERSTDNMEVEETAGVKLLRRAKQLLLTEREHIYRVMADGARKQANYYVADLYMKLSLKASKSVQAICQEEATNTFSFPFFHSLVKLYCMKAR